MNQPKSLYELVREWPNTDVKEREMNIKLLAVKRDGTQALLEIELPFTVSASAADEKFTMFHLHDANGTDHYFNKDDGTYDGWGKAFCDESQGAG